MKSGIVDPEVTRMAHFESLRKSRECPVCDRRKQPGIALCARCLYRLPGHFRRELYQEPGERFNRGVEKAIAFLESKNEDGAAGAQDRRATAGIADGRR